MTAPYPYLDSPGARWLIYDNRDDEPIVTVPFPGLPMPPEVAARTASEWVVNMNRIEGWERYTTVPLPPTMAEIAPWGFAPGWFRQLGNPADADFTEWSELEAAGASGVVGEGGGGERSAGEWKAATYPLFGPDVVANELLQAIDGTGGEGVKFSARSISRELAGQFRPGVLKTKLGEAVRKLEARGFVREARQVSDADRAKLSLPLRPPRGAKREWVTAYELTLLGHQAALASRVVPAIRSGEAAAEVEPPVQKVERFGRVEEVVSPGDPAAWRRELESHGIPPSRQQWSGYQTELVAPWRSFVLGFEPSPFAHASGQTLTFSREEQGGYVVFRAWDVSDYMLGRPIIMGELWLRLSGGDPYWQRPHSRATVVWVWVHREWDEGWLGPEWEPYLTPAQRRQPFVLKRLHELAAEEAARHKLALASGVERSGQADRFWSYQVKQGRAFPERRQGPGGFEAMRFVLQYPPPRSLENPARRSRRTNVSGSGGGGGDVERREAERAALHDPTQRMRLYGLALREGRVIPEHLAALAVLGDAVARELVWESAGSTGPLPKILDESVAKRLRAADSPELTKLALRFNDGLSSLGSFFTILCSTSLASDLWESRWHGDRRSAGTLARRVLPAAREWVAGREPRGRGAKLTQAVAEGRIPRFLSPTGEWASAEAFQHALSSFFRGHISLGASTLPRGVAYSTATQVEAMLRGLAVAVFRADVDPQDALAPRMAVLAILRVEDLLTDHHMILTGAPERLPPHPETELSRRLLEVLTPWVLAGSPDRWELPAPRPLDGHVRSGNPHVHSGMG